MAGPPSARSEGPLPAWLGSGDSHEVEPCGLDVLGRAPVSPTVQDASARDQDRSQFGQGDPPGSARGFWPHPPSRDTLGGLGPMSQWAPNVSPLRNPRDMARPGGLLGSDLAGLGGLSSLWPFTGPQLDAAAGLHRGAPFVPPGLLSAAPPGLMAADVARGTGPPGLLPDGMGSVPGMPPGISTPSRSGGLGLLATPPVHGGGPSTLDSSSPPPGLGAGPQSAPALCHSPGVPTPGTPSRAPISRPPLPAAWPLMSSTVDAQSPGVLSPLGAFGLLGNPALNPKVLSVTELEHQMLESAGSPGGMPPPLPGFPGPAATSVAAAHAHAAMAAAAKLASPGRASPVRPPGTMPAPGGLPTIADMLRLQGTPPGWNSCVRPPLSNRGTWSPQPPDSQRQPLTPHCLDTDRQLFAGVVTPFTKDHIALLGALPQKSVQPFLRNAQRLRERPGMMSSSDQELIVRIQRSQMAAMGGLSLHNYREPLVHHARKSEDFNGGAHTEQKNSDSHAGTLVSKLKETICNETFTEDAPAPASSLVEQTETPRTEEATDVLRSGLPSDAKFGRLPYASVLHPRQAIHIEGGEAAVGRDSFQEAASPSSKLETPRPTAESDPTEYWRMQALVERNYTTLLDLEQLSARISDCTAVETEKREKLLQERARLLDRVADQLFGVTSFATGDGSAALTRILEYRKGRMLLRRILLCLAPPPADSPDRSREEALPVLRLLWRLTAALLSMPGTVSRLAKPPRSQGDVSWSRLRFALAKAVSAACSSGNAIMPGGCASALAALLESHSGGRLLALCVMKSGTSLVKQLVAGCRAESKSGDEGTDRSLSELLAGLIEAMCEALPVLYEVAATRQVPQALAPVAGPLEDGDLLSKEDLWAVFIALTEVATARQKERMRELIGQFVVEVNKQY